RQFSTALVSSCRSPYPAASREHHAPPVVRGRFAPPEAPFPFQIFAAEVSTSAFCTRAVHRTLRRGLSSDRAARALALQQLPRPRGQSARVCALAPFPGTLKA